MKKLVLVAAAFLFTFGIITPPAAEARVFVSAGFGYGYGYGYPGYYPYPAYYAPYYVAPPPVVYAVPPPSPVIYAAPAGTAPGYAPTYAPAAPANQTSPTYIDSQGRTCRQYQSTSGGPAFGTACLMPDGTWRAIQ